MFGDEPIEFGPVDQLRLTDSEGLCVLVREAVVVPEWSSFAVLVVGLRAGPWRHLVLQAIGAFAESSIEFCGNDLHCLLVVGHQPPVPVPGRLHTSLVDGPW